jgi:hypothetical protein
MGLVPTSAELLRRTSHRPVWLSAARRGLHGGSVDHDVIKRDDAGGVGTVGGTADIRADACRQFIRIDRLCNVVVGSKID